MKKSYQTLLIVTLLFAATGLYSQWVIVSSGGTKDLNSITFSSGYGYTAGDSGIVKRTLDFGLTWGTVPSFSTVNLNSTYAISPAGVFVCGEQGMIYKTTNSGVNWAAQTSLTNGITYHAIDFINSSTGIVVGDNRRFAITANGGTNWITGQLNVTVGSNLHYRAVDMLDSTTTYIASTDTVISGTYYAYVQKTTNNGISFSNVLTFNAGTANRFVHIQFINSNTGWAITDRGYCIKTTNGGVSWSYNLMNMLCDNAYFINANIGYACGTGGGLKKTTNGGLTWLWQNSPTTGNLSDITCTDTNTAISAGVDGIVVRTDNGGTYTEINQTSGNIPGSYSLGQNYPNPFNPSTKITFDIPEGSDVKLTLYNILGMEVMILTDRYLKAGTYEVNLNASGLPSGTYFYRLNAGQYTETKKMMLIK